MTGVLSASGSSLIGIGVLRARSSRAFAKAMPICSGRRLPKVERAINDAERGGHADLAITCVALDHLQCRGDLGACAQKRCISPQDFCRAQGSEDLAHHFPRGLALRERPASVLQC